MLLDLISWQTSRISFTNRLHHNHLSNVTNSLFVYLLRSAIEDRRKNSPFQHRRFILSKKG